MWLDLYLVLAVIAAVAVWLVSPQFASYDAPGDASRAVWSAVAGALWPVVVVGAVQIVIIRHVARRLHAARVPAMEPAPVVTVPHADLRS